MVFETIGMMAVFATQNTNTKNIIVVGSVATMPYIKTVFAKIEKMYNLKFIIPLIFIAKTKFLNLEI